MEKQTMGEIISTLRRERAMTQKDLAEKMGVTDKAVSKWERNLSCPDVTTIPHLAEVLDTTVERLLDVEPSQKTEGIKKENIPDLILKAIPLAMGVALTVISVLEWKNPWSAYFWMTGIAVFCLSLRQLRE